jgi:hypothetical protein
VKISLAKYIIVAWFSFLLLLGNTPMDFIHLFADHKDTIHHEHKGLVIENKHHHCAFLSLTLTSFINDYTIPFVAFRSIVHRAKYTFAGVNYVQRCIVAVSLRGPPTV